MRDKTDHTTFELPGFELAATLPLAVPEPRRATPRRPRRAPQVQEALLFREGDCQTPLPA
jgi:hypothetical protein